MSYLCGMHIGYFPKRAFFKVINFPSPGLHQNDDASCIKRTSLLNGSMTVEAAVILPCFLFFFINLSSCLEMIRLHGNLMYAMHSAGNEICLYGSLLTDEMKDLGPTGHVTGSENGVSNARDGSTANQESSSEEDTDLLSLAEGSLLSYTYVKYRMIGELTEDYLSSSPLVSGSQSLNFLGSTIGDGDIVDIKLSCAVETPLDELSPHGFYLAGRFYGHLWNGYEVSGDGTHPDQEQIVYITEDSEVYHVTTACTHLRLTIRGTEYANLESERNRNGGRYYPCEICAHGDPPEIVYIGAEGDRFHYSDECYTLTRSYSPVPLSEVEETHRPCSRCGG